MDMKRSTCCWILLASSLVQIGCSSSGSDSDSGADSGGGMSPDIPLTPEPMGPINQDFITFDTGQVRPLALAADGSRLFATNTPNSTLDIFTISNDGLTLESSVPVGMEPVSVALFGDEQAWVVNHLSDSVSVVDIAAVPPRVVKTLLVGDEPRDIVFAGDTRSRAFITTAHRGQNGPDDLPIDAELFTPSVGRADVWVFDANGINHVW